MLVASSFGAGKAQQPIGFLEQPVVTGSGGLAQPNPPLPKKKETDDAFG